MKNLILLASLLFIGCSSETTVYPDSTDIHSLGYIQSSYNNPSETFQSRLNGISETGWFYFDNGTVCRPYDAITSLEGSNNYQMKDLTVQYLSNTIFIGNYYTATRIDDKCKIYTSRNSTLSEWLIQDGYATSRYGNYSSYEYDAKLYEYGLWRYYNYGW
jgi:hypothetical protein